MNTNKVYPNSNFLIRFKGQLIKYNILLIVGLFVFIPGILLAQSKEVYRQPAYINNAYFSDKISQKGENVQPLSIVKALQTRVNGVLGYFILDLILIQKGAHYIKVDILNQKGKKTSELLYPPVQVNKEDILPMYTAAGTISGDLESGLWFFRVQDQVNKGKWNELGTFSILVMEPK